MECDLTATIGMLTAPFTVDCAPPILTARFARPQRTLGWSLLYPGLATVQDVVWLEVRNADLGRHVDPSDYLRSRLADHGLSEALAFMTSRDIRRHHQRLRQAEDVAAACLTTVGLSNGERVGSRRPHTGRIGTINTLVHVDRPLTDGALVEALALVAQARTLAVLEAQPRTDAAITGTGTDCIVVACPCEGEPTPWAGLHTAVGEAIGGAVYDATREGVATWLDDSRSF